MQFIRKMLKNEKGATAIEYGLIAALIAVAAADSAYPAYPKGYDYVSSYKMVIKEIFL